MVTQKEFDELKKRIDKLEKKNTHNTTDTLNYLPTGFYPHTITNLQACENIYHRTCRQLKEHLNRNGFPVKSLSRSSVGQMDFYNLSFRIPDKEDKWHEKTDDYLIAKFLDIDGVGLVDFSHKDEEYFIRLLINEKELNDKYLKNGNLVFD